MRFSDSFILSTLQVPFHPDAAATLGVLYALSALVAPLCHRWLSKTRVAWWFNWADASFREFATTAAPNTDIQLFSVTPGRVGILNRAERGQITATIFEP